MASSNDFTANQIRVAKLILTGTQPGDGGIGVRNIGLAVYDESLATNQTGGISDANIFDSAGTDVAIFVSGSQKSRGTNANSGDGVFLLGGDSYISGTLVVENAGRTHGSISGSIQRMADGRSYLVAGSNITISSASDGQVTITGGAGDDGMGSGFVLEDDDGTEVTITEFKEVKFIGAGGIVTNWTDVSNGTDIDPYDLTFTAADLTFAGDGGSNQALTLGDTFTIEGGTNVTTAMATDKVTINATDTNTQNTTTLSFVDSSDDIILRNTTGGATSSTDDITFVAGSNITLTYTDADNITIASSGGGGSYSFDIDANGGTAETISNTNTVGFNEGIGTFVSRTSKDIQIAASGSAQTLVYSHMGPHYLLSGSYGVTAANTGMNAMKTGVTDAIVSANGTGTWQPGPVSSFLPGSGETPPAIGFKTVIPKGATKIKLTLFCKANYVGGGGGDPSRPVQFVWAGRYYEVGEEVNTGNTDGDGAGAGKGMWLGDSEGTTAAREGWRVFPDFTVSNPHQFRIESAIENISAVVNSDSSPANGGILDIAIARNRNNGDSAVFGTTSDTYTNTVHVIYVKVEFPIT